MRTSILIAAALAGSAYAADRAAMPYESARVALEAMRAELPAELRNADEAVWTRWNREQDRAIRARLAQGDLDSMVNLLLFGTSFTTQPRIEIETLAESVRAGRLRARVDDFLAAVRSPGANERLAFMRSLLASQGQSPDDPRTGVFLLQNLERVLKEGLVYGQRNQEPNAASVFRDRGVSLDATILPNFGVELALRELLERGLLPKDGVRRIAVVGPGLDFIDKQSGYDYYPQQTLQPFAVYDSSLRLGLASEGRLSVTVFDISPRVRDHLRRAREDAQAGRGYFVQLPRDPAAKWTPAAVAYWRSFGDRVGEPAQPAALPATLAGLETRAVRLSPETVLACETVDLNVVVDRIELPETGRFDVVVATNILVYYDAFEQALAMENIAAMLTPDGVLLSNDKLPEAPGLSLHAAGSTAAPYVDGGYRDVFFWYRR